MKIFPWNALAGVVLLSQAIGAATAPAAPPPAEQLSQALRSLDANVLPADLRERSVRMLRDAARSGVRAVNQRDREAWAKIRTRSDWEKWRTPRLEALRESLGSFPPKPADLHERITRTLEGEGFRIENLVYQSRPDLLVTANLYVPAPPRVKMPGILLVPSHHNPKVQGELQDMGMTWARHGCLVLVIDQLSYGERRQHAAGNRQDYRFRYINGIQLHLIGDSLMGWMVCDIMRGVDVLLRREGIDRDKIILIGSVAGGGDPAAVAAALDPRIACAIPFNFGGPQPETAYPLPADADETFNYLGSGSWESTRNLRRSGSDGFLPWLIVGSVTPRRLIYAHEFSWDRERDPVWKRLQQVFAFYGAQENLAFAHGGGVLQGKPPEATHCNNVGAVHRKMIHPVLERWFGIPIPQEYQNRLPPDNLQSLPLESKPRPLHELLSEIGADRAAAFRAQLQKLSRTEQRRVLRRQWASLLGDIEPRKPRVLRHTTERIALNPPLDVERIALETEPGILLPILLALPGQRSIKPPVVIALSQHGKGRFLSDRTGTISELIEHGVAVCLPDLRGTGETSPAGTRHYRSEATSVSATELMLGRALLGSRLQDLRSIVRYLRSRSDLNARRLALWGDSFAPVNPSDLVDPLIDEGQPPEQSEPMGGLLALLGALYERDVRAVVANGTFPAFQAVLRDRFCYVPHDAIVPGALTAGDLCDVAAAFAPRPLRMARLIDGRNVPMAAEDVRQLLSPTLNAYRRIQTDFQLLPNTDSDLASWFLQALRP
ncbi:MAG: hypothetical protein HY735_26630 [Verrucomicrobia bacterium]|nr:hypothetical protein [Verrucomicrobiota bacterium]